MTDALTLKKVNTYRWVEIVIDVEKIQCVNIRATLCHLNDRGINLYKINQNINVELVVLYFRIPKFECVDWLMIADEKYSWTVSRPLRKRSVRYKIELTLIYFLPQF